MKTCDDELSEVQATLEAATATFEDEQAAHLETLNLLERKRARVATLERANEMLDEDLTAARRDLADSRRVVFMLVTQLGGEVVIGGSVLLRLDEAHATIETSRDPGGDLRIRAALAAPAAGEEGKR